MCDMKKPIRNLFGPKYGYKVMDLTEDGLHSLYIENHLNYKPDDKIKYSGVDKGNFLGVYFFKKLKEALNYEMLIPLSKNTVIVKGKIVGRQWIDLSGIIYNLSHPIGALLRLNRKNIIRTTEEFRIIKIVGTKKY